jgi:hypothetical protein
MIFVFGSNEAGRHGAGAALDALRDHGAIYGQGFGRQGNSFAIPTKNRNLKPLPLSRIKEYVMEFRKYARAHPELRFKVTRIGCDLAGYTDEQIAPMFYNAPGNCILTARWELMLHI